VESLKQIVLEELSRLLEDVQITMIKDVPPDIEGDFSFPCFAHAKKAKKKPHDFALDLASDLGRSGGFIKTAKAKDGFVNISINSNKLAEVLLDEIYDLKEDYGKGIKRKRNFIVEHTSANPNAPLHIGHLRNSIIGDSMVRILRYAGYETEAQFLINDMGGQLAILASYMSNSDYEEDLEKSGKKPDVWLGETYVKANKEVDPEVAKALQKNYENGGKDIRKIFDFMVRTALDGMKETFKDYNISMDSYVRESDFVFGSAVHDVIERLKQTPNWFEKEGTSAVNLEKYGIKKELVLLRSDGTTLYTTRDLAYHLWKLRKADCINVIANEQTLQQRQLRAGLDLMGIADAETRVRHLSYELVTVPGMRMSSRTGEFISADQLLEEGRERALKEINKRELDVPPKERKKISRAVAQGAIRFNMVKITPLKPIEFRWDEALNFEGESSPYLQYSHARACRILEKSGKAGEPEYGTLELTEEESKLLIALAQMPDIIESSAQDLKPNLLANYLVNLAEAFNRFYFKCPVLDSEEPLKSARIRMVKAFKQVMSNGLRLLGIEALERM
jgi:arginyl-tRNA synthetase